MDNWFGELRAAIDADGRALREISVAAGLGPNYVQQMLKKEQPPKLATLDKLLEVLDAGAAERVRGALPPEPRTKGQPIHYVPGEQLILPGREQLLPIYSGAEGGLGKLIIGSDVVDRIEMPAYLRDVRGAYGIMCDGSSMQPEFWPGDIAYVNPILRPMRGQPHIFYHTPPLGEDAEAIIKHLLGWNDREWDLQQWNPAKQFSESRKIWPICHRVVGKKNAG
jgi:transcriptional regulator with XRE-family HTH domain